MNQIVRQGDVLLVPVKAIPEGTKSAMEKGRAVLAYGEVTGHAHVIDAPKRSLNYRVTPEGKRFVELIKKVVLRHEEHSAIHLVEGKMQQGFQVEDYGQEIRRVAD